MKNKKTRKNRNEGGGLFNFLAKTFVSDNKPVSLKSSKGSIKCSICSHTTFQERNGTIGKSKTADIIRGESETNDISVYCYFCNNCGNAIIVRDPKVTTNNYKQLITSTAL
jgi:hypothetical protein